MTRMKLISLLYGAF